MMSSSPTKTTEGNPATTQEQAGPTTTQEQASRAEQEKAHPVYVYGIIPASEAQRSQETPGLGEPASPVRTVIEGELAALVSDLPPDYTPGRRQDLEAHQRVLSEAIERGTTVPMRFGIVMDDDETVREKLLKRHASVLSDVLHRLDGDVQMTLKVYYLDDELLKDALVAHPELAEESARLAQFPETEAQDARIRFGEALAQAIEERREQIESALVDVLRPVADDIRVDPPKGEQVALIAHLLVARDRRAELDEEVRKLSESLAGILAFRYIGPLAPYAFADLSLKDEEGKEPWD
jgi:Gas vesicle synthesis protein GvpL/GvpF